MTLPIPLTPTSDRWVARAAADVRTLLLDHAHCEKKAASTAIGLVFRAPGHAELCLALSRLAREELLHFERLLALLAVRGVPFERQVPSAYAAKLLERVRRERASGARTAVPPLVEELLVAALIEARSTERFRRLAEAPLATDLTELFAELAEVEDRHGSVYTNQACALAPEARVAARLAELAAFEGSILESPEAPLRLHAG